MNNSQEITVQSAFPLSGTLTIPSEARTAHPAVLIISGSGKGDRDGNLKNLQMNMYKDLAEFLTAKGFVTFRYDKRGTYQSGGNFLEAGLNDLIEDAAACVKFLQSHPSVNSDQVLILGHSEGALIAPAVCKKVPVSGLILLAGGAKSSKELSDWQKAMAYVEMDHAKGFKGWLFRVLNATEKAKKQDKKIFEKIVATEQSVMRVQGIKINAKYLRETMAYNTADYLQEVECPVLAITGDKDVQVPPEDVKLIAELVRGEAEWHIIPQMNHLMRKYEGNHTMLGLMKEYKTLADQPLDQDMLDKIEEWLEKYYK